MEEGKWWVERSNMRNWKIHHSVNCRSKVAISSSCQPPSYSRFEERENDKELERKIEEIRELHRGWRRTWQGARRRWRQRRRDVCIKREEIENERGERNMCLGFLGGPCNVNNLNRWGHFCLSLQEASNRSWEAPFRLLLKTSRLRSPKKQVKTEKWFWEISPNKRKQLIFS